MAKRPKNKPAIAPTESRVNNDQVIGRVRADRAAAGELPPESRSAAGSLIPTPKSGEPAPAEDISPSEARAEMAALFGESETNQDLSTDNIELLDAQLKAKGVTLSEVIAEPVTPTVDQLHVLNAGIVSALSGEDEPTDVFNPGEGRLVLVQYDPIRITAEAVEALVRPKFEPIDAGIIRMTVMADRRDVRDARIEAIKEHDVVVLIIPAMSVTHAHQFYPLSSEADILLVVSELGYEIHKWRGVLDYSKEPQAF